MNLHVFRTLLTIASVFVAFSISQAQVKYAYIANDLSNAVTAINTSNNKVAKVISVGSFPWGIAVNPSATFVYVTNYASNSVSVISTSKNAVTATIGVGSGPLGVVFAPNGKKAYVANDLSNSVSVIDTAGKKAVATVAVGSKPYGIVITPNGDFVYVANSGATTVSVIKTATNKVIATVTVGTTPAFLAMSPDGSRVYAPNNGSNSISVIETAHNTVVHTIKLDGAWGASITPNGKWLYATDFSKGKGDLITIIDTATFAIEKKITVDKYPQEVAFSATGEFAYVTSGGVYGNDGANTVTVINTSSMTKTAVIKVDPSPVGIAVMGEKSLAAIGRRVVLTHHRRVAQVYREVMI